MKYLIGEIATNIAAVKQEHEATIGVCLLASSMPRDNLSTSVTCSILMLTEGEDKSGIFHL
ncbi:hypothetical protein BCV72DRAFT_329691, partial [Rhizopus microsporus var. microsporus]